MKRATDEASAGADDPNKRPRMDVPGSGKASLSLDALEKAKKALQLQKDLKEKLKKLPQVGCTTAFAAWASLTNT